MQYAEEVMTASNMALWAFVILSATVLAFAALVLGKMWKGNDHAR
jgi:hypothetical protein